MQLHAKWGTVAFMAFIASPTSAQSVSDAGCLLASNIAAKRAQDPKAKQLAQAAGFYYLGRVDAMMSLEQLRLALTREQKALEGKNVGSLMAGCVRRMQERVNRVQNAGQQPGSGK